MERLFMGPIVAACILVSAFTLAGPTTTAQSIAPVSLSAVSFADVSHGWVSASAGNRAYVFRTLDGGRSWTRQSAPALLTHMQFVDAEHGWGIGLAPAGCLNGGGPCPSVVLRTTDGGKTWQTHHGAQCTEFSLLQMISLQRGWVVATENNCSSHRAYSRILRTDDGGVTWRQVLSAKIQVTGLHFGDALHGWITGDDAEHCDATALSTSDGGARWSQRLRIRGFCRGSIDFVDALHGWLLVTSLDDCSMGGCYGNRLYRTQDGGAHWQLLHDSTNKRHLWSGVSGFPDEVRFGTTSTGIIPVNRGAGPGMGGLDITTDGGQHWTRRLQAFSLYAGQVSLVTTQILWALRCSGASMMCGTLLRTQDAGASWQRIYL